MSFKFKNNVFNRDDANAAMVVLTNNDNHNHPQEDTYIEDAEAVNMMRNPIVQQPVKRIYHATVVHLHQQARIHGAAAPSLSYFHIIRSSLFRTKAPRCPPVPQGINEVQIESYLGERYLLPLDNKEWQYLVRTFFGADGGKHNIIRRRDIPYCPGSISSNISNLRRVFGSGN